MHPLPERLHATAQNSWLAYLLLFCFMPAIASSAELVSADRAMRHGLERAWFSQVTLDATRSHVVDWKLWNNRLYSLTSAGMLQAIDSETGTTLWSARVGSPGGSYAGLGVNDRFVAAVSGSYMHILDTKGGHLRDSHRLASAPAAAPVLSDSYVFAAMNSGLVEGYPLDDTEQIAWYHQSVGRIFHAPTVTGEVLSWPTDRGYLYVSQSNSPRVLYRVEIGSEIVAAPTELQPYLYVTSRNGYLYCVNELTGDEHWRWSTGFPVITKPAVVATTAYVASEEPALHALHYKTGELKWIASGVSKFAMEGKQNAYGIDRFGNLIVIDKQNGSMLARLNTGEGTTALVNDQSDRIFLVSERGLIQCFHEAQADEPTYYRLAPVEETEKETTSEDPFTKETPDDESPGDDSPFTDADSPFGGDDKSPFTTDEEEDESGDDQGSPFDDDSPFGDF